MMPPPAYQLLIVNKGRAKTEETPEHAFARIAIYDQFDNVAFAQIDAPDQPDQKVFILESDEWRSLCKAMAEALPAEAETE